MKVFELGNYEDYSIRHDPSQPGWTIFLCHAKWKELESANGFQLNPDGHYIVRAVRDSELIQARSIAYHRQVIDAKDGVELKDAEGWHHVETKVSGDQPQFVRTLEGDLVDIWQAKRISCDATNPNYHTGYGKRYVLHRTIRHNC